jgi:hypothetical protein
MFFDSLYTANAGVQTQVCTPQVKEVSTLNCGRSVGCVVRTNWCMKCTPHDWWFNELSNNQLIIPTIYRSHALRGNACAAAPAARSAGVPLDGFPCWSMNTMKLANKAYIHDMKEKEIETIITNLDTWVRDNQQNALGEYQTLFGSNSIHVMHAHLGRNNNTFVDSVRTQFTDPDDFIARWIAGLKIKLDLIRSSNKRCYEGKLFSEEIVYHCLQNEVLREYTFKFLTRNFYRNFCARIRAKPKDELWSIWFGSGNLCWGLVISPAFRNATWTNDKSQMRREKYQYWTIGHILDTGLINPESKQPLKFNSLNDFAVFYESVLKRISNSFYEKEICEKYLLYLSESTTPNDEPLLIPELRYAGLEKKHEYRLDFAILNGHTSLLTGYELSPSSTHIAVKGIKDKTQKIINEELASQWQKEVNKRNLYFEKFGIPIVTFADNDLKDTDACFAKMRFALEARKIPKISISEALNALQAP